MEWLRRENPAVANNLQPQGGIGFWARNGYLHFSDATVTIRPLVE